MASQSPEADKKTREYENGWAAMTHLMNAGQSWSGRERKSAFLNFRDGSFATVSAAAGLDFPDDGRALALCDWDQDGDLDLWFKNRTGPVLRFFRNDDRSGNRWIAFHLEGNGKSSNRDAIGARVGIWVGGKKRIQELSCGNGYLAQSSSWLHFGLDRADKIEKIVIRWPDRQTQEIAGLAVNKSYRVTQGAAATEASFARAELPDAPLAMPKAENTGRIVLRVPLAMPPSVIDGLFRGREVGHAGFINLWASWCKPCVGELDDFAKHFAEFREVGLEFLALGTDKAEDQPKASEFLQERFRTQPNDLSFRTQFADPRTLGLFEAILKQVRFFEEDLSLPTSFLIDKNGNLQIVYVGPVSAEQLVLDAITYGVNPEKVTLRSPFAGRWYYGIGRDLNGFAKDLRNRGLEDEARFYEMRAKAEQQRFERK